MNPSNKDLSQLWDVIIIGTGMGGATVGYALAQKDLSVLFLEKGCDVAAGQSAEVAILPDVRIKQGWWPQPYSQLRKDGKYNQIYASIGCGMGGSSMHYAAALERMEPTDFEALQTANHLNDCWPVSYDDFLPYYKAAEKLYGIDDESEEVANARLSEWDKSLIAVMQEAGLKPKRLRVAIKYDKDCTECIGKVCHRSCKADARVTCLDKALLNNNCFLLDTCDVTSLEADLNQVRYVHASHNGNTLKLSAKKIILAAGAMQSPQLLLKSANSFWPNGLANSSDQVGRNLMFHGAEIYAIWSPKRLNQQALQKKSLSIRDFYVYAGRRLGYVQSLGMSAGRGHIAGFIKDTLRRYGLKNERLLSALAKIPSHIAARILGEAIIFSALIEDDPDPNNRIKLNSSEPNGATFSYSFNTDIRQRANDLYKTFSKHIGNWRVLRISPSLEINSGHPSGTCRFGTNPATSVLDASCRSHELHNLYVVDASFMPRSGAVNPSLTIAANALRVADKIIESFADNKQ